MKDLLEDYQDKIEEINKKQLQAVKEKALLKLEKDEAQKRVEEIQNAVKAHEQGIQKQLEAQMKRQRQGGKVDNMIVKGANTPWPEDARPNPYLTEEFKLFNERAN